MANDGNTSNLLNKTIKSVASAFDGGAAGAQAIITQKQKNDAYQLGQAGFDKDYVQKTVGAHDDIEAARKNGELEIGIDKNKRANVHKTPYK